MLLGPSAFRRGFHAWSMTFSMLWYRGRRSGTRRRSALLAFYRRNAPVAIIVSTAIALLGRGVYQTSLSLLLIL